MISKGDKVPVFELQNSNAQTINSKKFEGKKYVIYFYPKDFTPGCTTEADEFSKMYQEFKNRKIEIVGISPDSVESHSKFCKKMNIPYTLLADPDKTVANTFGVWGKKKFIGREYMGVIRSTFLVNEDGVIFKSYPKVKPAGHARQVLDDFDSVSNE